MEKTMNRKIIIISAVAVFGISASATSFAQSSVTLYGVLDKGVEMVTHANANGNTVVRLPTITGALPSRLGLRGVEDLGGGISTVFVLESGISLLDGSLLQGGRLFGRQAWVGFQGPYGMLSFGRQYSMTFWALQDSDLLGPDIYGGVGSFDSYIPNARSDNTIAYKGTWNGITAGATYSFGRDATGTGNSPGQGTCPKSSNLTACRQWSVMLRYDAPHFGVAAAYEEQRGGPSAEASFFDGVAPFALTDPGDKDVRMQLNGYVLAGTLKIGGGWLGRQVNTVAAALPNVHSNIFYLTASYPVTPAFIVDGGIYRIVNGQQDARGTIIAIRTTYLLSKRTAVYWQGGYLFNSAHASYTLSQGGPGATPGAGMGQLGLMIGVRHSF
jgi:predicted porin